MEYISIQPENSLPIINAAALSDPGTMFCGTPSVKASLWLSSESSFLQILNSPTEPQPVEKPMCRTWMGKKVFLQK